MKFVVCFIVAALCVYVKSAPAPNSELASPAIPDDTKSQATSAKETEVLSTDVIVSDGSTIKTYKDNSETCKDKNVGTMSAPVMAVNYVQDRVNEGFNAVGKLIDDVEDKATGAKKMVEDVQKFTDVGFDKAEEVVGSVLGDESGAVKVIDGAQTFVDNGFKTAGYVLNVVEDKAEEAMEFVDNVSKGVGKAINDVKNAVMG